jgi:hypothetical protein
MLVIMFSEDIMEGIYNLWLGVHMICSGAHFMIEIKKGHDLAVSVSKK